MTKMTIVAAIADKDQISLYSIDGGVKVISSDDYRIEEIMDEVLPKIAKHQKAEIDISEYEALKEFEASTDGVVVFLTVGKEKVRAVLYPEENSTITADDIIKTGKKTDSISVSVDETIVAVVDNKVIPGMEKLEKQFNRSNQSKSKGMEKFLQRIATVIDKRAHSVEDLLTFMEKADLPIADDGTVIAYKVLASTESPKVFVDKHTRRVKQKVGSIVFMKENLVDHDNRNQCSNGLHIARRGYISGFYAKDNPVVICKIAPEDFIAVPSYDADKVRVSRYHIVAKLPVEAAELLNDGKPITNYEPMKALLGSIIAGKKDTIIETVEITQNQGGGLKITPMDGKKPKVKAKSKKVKAIDIDNRKGDKSKVSPKTLRKKADNIIQSSTKTIAEQARELYEAGKFQALQEFKKIKKKSFKALGFDPSEIDKIN